MKRNQDVSLWGGDIWDLLEDFSTRSRKGFATFNPAVDVEEDESQYRIHFDLPGVSKDDVKIELNDHQLVVSGERKPSQRESDAGVRYLSERKYGSFQRAFSLPSQVNANQIEAGYQDGVLTIVVPKSEAAKPRTIKIGEGRSARLDNSAA